MDEGGKTQVLLEEVRGQFAAVLDVVAPLSQDVLEIKETLANHGSRFDKLEGQMSGVISTLRVHGSDINEIKSDVKVLKSDVAVLKSDVAVLKSDVTVLKSDVAVLKSDVTVLKSDVTVLKLDVHEIRSDVNEIRQDLTEVKTYVVRHDEAITALRAAS